MPAYIDQTGHKLFLERTPQRIISLVPSQTELLAELSLNNEVVGITKFCIRPTDWYHSKQRIGGTKNIKIELIRQLVPDLILANKEENDKNQVETCKSFCPVWVSDIRNLPDALHMILCVGRITNKESEAQNIVNQINHQFSSLFAIQTKPRTAYLVWNKPCMAAGGDSFIHSMMEMAGFQNVFEDRKRYPEINLEDLVACSCECLFLSSEPFPFRENHLIEIKNSLKTLGGDKIRIMLVNGEFFSWYGSRLQYAPAYFQRLRQQFNESEPVTT